MGIIATCACRLSVNGDGCGTSEQRGQNEICVALVASGDGSPPRPFSGGLRPVLGGIDVRAHIDDRASVGGPTGRDISLTQE